MKKHGFETCTECGEVFNCPIFVRRKIAEWIPAAHNLRQIKERGLESWLREQEEGQALLERLLRDYNEGRSMSLFCKVCARMPVDLINKAIAQAREKLAGDKVDEADVKLKARVFKAVIKDSASQVDINLD